MRYEGRSLTLKERAYFEKIAPEGTVLIVRGFTEFGGGYVGCIRFFDSNDNLLSMRLYR